MGFTRAVAIGQWWTVRVIGGPWHFSWTQKETRWFNLLQVYWTMMGQGTILISLGLNLPTGKSALFGAAAYARMDPDLVELSSFGEGTNIGPTIGFNIPLTSAVLLTFSVGHTWRGSFNLEDSLLEKSPTGQMLHENHACADQCQRRASL